MKVSFIILDTPQEELAAVKDEASALLARFNISRVLRQGSSLLACEGTEYDFNRGSPGIFNIYLLFNNDTSVKTYMLQPRT